MADTGERSGTVVSGDVTIAYRAFGAKGRTPILILHGTNFYDSTDWIGVAGKLATDREVAVPDRRGFGRSSWSPSKDYSLDAILGDIGIVIGKLGWQRPIVMGHSGAGRHVVSFAANFPDMLSRLIVVDSAFGREEGGRARQPTGNPILAFSTVEDAMAHFAKLSNPPRIAKDRARALEALTKLENGYALKRDPDHANANPVGETEGLPRRPPGDIWSELQKVRCPTLIVRGLRSDRYPPDVLARIKRERPDLAWAEVDSEHDVPFQAPDALVAAVRGFIGTA